ncbi:hypothetical protein SAMN05421505_15323 [Sinosporangium album]|uniref:Uncharacterized protein n=1 Tax=Sinosporangium album TaxID=504805 RepID=A0A1G8KRU2_9ACTN|nr:hypothetical protein [Sinosporangium album]SDI45630.1 hypothetical protein SAMN05421505_15323 [Sinosporangium album]
MSATDFVAAVLRRGDELRELLGPQTGAHLATLLRRILDEEPRRARRTWNEILTVLRRGLPRDHDLRPLIADAATTHRGTAVADDLAPALDLLREMLPDLAALDPGLLDSAALDPATPATPEPAPPPATTRPVVSPDAGTPEAAPPPGTAQPTAPSGTAAAVPEAQGGDAFAEAFEAVKRSLLAAPSLDPAELRDPDDPRLLRLDRPDGGVAVPAFQFGDDGAPIPVVLAVNELLDAARDPWGTADWWLRGNALLGGAPAALLARGVADDLLTEAARALREPY